MAISRAYLSILKAVLDKRDTSGLHTPRTRAICISYPDINVTTKDMSQILGKEILPKLKIRTDFSQYKSIDGKLVSPTHAVYDTESVLENIGIDADFIDIKKLRGPEKIVDLNEPLPAEFHDSYDLVIDVGTLEHCFNVGNAFKSMCQMAKVGAHVVTLAPMSMVNHGFWNFSPTACLTAHHIGPKSKNNLW